MCFPFGHVTCVFPMNQSCGRNVHWMMNIAFSFKSKLRLKGFTSQSKIVASSVIMMVTVITKSESRSCFVFTVNNILLLLYPLLSPFLPIRYVRCCFIYHFYQSCLKLIQLCSLKKHSEQPGTQHKHMEKTNFKIDK